MVDTKPPPPLWIYIAFLVIVGLVFVVCIFCGAMVNSWVL